MSCLNFAFKILTNKNPFTYLCYIYSFITKTGYAIGKVLITSEDVSIPVFQHTVMQKYTIQLNGQAAGWMKFLVIIKFKVTLD